jgi:two-component system, chemotaxis family, CheB/CheR fusion protein
VTRDFVETSVGSAPLDDPSYAKGGHSSSVRRLGLISIGASAGGLETVSRFLESLPDFTIHEHQENPYAFVFIQHLEPKHKSLLVELLSLRTKLKVVEAFDGAPLEAGTIYVIAPGDYLSLELGLLHLSTPPIQRAVRLPIDFWLSSVAKNFTGPKVCIILSGYGADGSESLRAFKASGGFIIAQDPEGVKADIMPRSAIATGYVDQTLKVDAMWASAQAHMRALWSHSVKSVKSLTLEPVTNLITNAVSESIATEDLSAIIEVLRTKTRHDFKLYKPGTLQRRIARRMGLLSIQQAEVKKYLNRLHEDPDEAETLAKDLLIHVTSFFRDPKTFDYLTHDVLPKLIEKHMDDKSIRIWIAGCSTGEEAYSLAILFLEAIRKARVQIKLQIFASDIDPETITFARQGLYPMAINAQVSEERLKNFFIKDEQGYQVKTELRDCLVFTVQDVLSDPPFSRLDMVSCRNVLIYLNPEAQACIIAQFHFSLKPDGLLLLGSAETIGAGEGAFEKLTKTERLYRRKGLSRVPQLDYRRGLNPPHGTHPLEGSTQKMTRTNTMEQVCRNKVIELFAPAAFLINAKDECLYSLGPIESYVSFQSGLASLDLMNMVTSDLRIKLRLLISLCKAMKVPQSSSAKFINATGQLISFEIKVVAIEVKGETYWLVCFIDHQNAPASNSVLAIDSHTEKSVGLNDSKRLSEMELELEATRAELREAILGLEIANQDHRAVNEEALSVNEEYQSTNEELLTSKEELQSLNEELTALNSQLQESLDIQRTLANDLKNVLFSTNIATLFLDLDLKIRFFTPATKSLFRILPTDVGRPLSDLNSLAVDENLAQDAQQILLNFEAIECEIKTKDDNWFLRTILPYRGHDNVMQGVVITFTDITERKSSSEALERAKLSAEQANKAKSRFLAAASHDLRQPLQSLALLQGLLAKTVQSERSQKLVSRLYITLEAMSVMLNTLLDINHFETGMIQANKVRFCIDELLNRLRDEFNYYANARNITFKVVNSNLVIYSDPALLEQILRNFLTNAFKYTQTGAVLIGCRRKVDHFSFEVWDQGIGIPESDLLSIFDEYHQVDNAARQRSLGLGLGLSIVKRLGTLLGHTVEVRSKMGCGSVFSVDVPNDHLQGAQPVVSLKTLEKATLEPEPETKTEPIILNAGKGNILIIEDDPEVREILEFILTTEGHSVMSIGDGLEALDKLTSLLFKPDIILSDFNLPKSMNGLEAMRKVREQQNRIIPVIILTGDISTSAMREIAAEKCIHLTKPVNLNELNDAIKLSLLKEVKPFFAVTEAVVIKKDLRIYVVDDDQNICESIKNVFEAEGMTVLTYNSAESFIETYISDDKACALIDAYLPGMNGLELIKALRAKGHTIPVVMITGNSDVSMAVDAMKAGALDFLEKPIGYADLHLIVLKALELARDTETQNSYQITASNLINGLTDRQREIMERVLKGEPSKNIAADLNISQRTVENHRAAIMTKTGMKSLPALARLSFAAQRIQTKA